MRFRSFFLSLLMLLLSVSAFAQNAAADNPQMASELRSSGKIYVVVIVLTTIFAGIIAFLIYLDRKLSRLEKTLKQ